MVNIFQIAVERLVEVGFYNFLLPFILFTTVMYAVLKKTQILGDSIVIHGILSVATGLFIFGVPVILGSSIVPALTSFVTQITILIVVILFGFLVASFFYPNIIEKLPDIFRSGGPAVWVVWVVVGIAASVGLFAFMKDPVQNLISAANVPGDLVAITIAIAVVFIVFMIVAVAGGKEVK